MNGADEDMWFDGRVLQTLPPRLIQGSSPPEACQLRQQRSARVDHSREGAQEPRDAPNLCRRDCITRLCIGPSKSAAQSPTLMPRSGSGKAAGGGLTRDPIALKIRQIEALRYS